MPITYVCGFLFDPKLRRVALIRKNRGPIGMTGHLNGIGGKVELGESARGAQAREFREETGLHTESFEWSCFHIERYIESGALVYFMTAIRENLEDVITATDEQVSLFYIADGRLPQWMKQVYNLDYLIPMALAWHKNPQHRYTEG